MKKEDLEKIKKLSTTLKRIIQGVKGDLVYRDLKKIGLKELVDLLDSIKETKPAKATKKKKEQDDEKETL